MSRKNVILISIMPTFVDNILKGIKKYEYRRCIPKNKLDTILIYSTFPTMKIVAYVKVEKIICLPLDALWNETKQKSGISKRFFMQYFHGKDKGYAYKLGKVVPLNSTGISKIGLKHPPQNFVYMSATMIKKLGVNF